MNLAATEIIRQGIGVYATRGLQPTTTTPWATTEQGAQVQAYQPPAPCRLPCPDQRITVISADASGTTNLTQETEGQPWGYRETRRTDYVNSTSRGPPSSGPPLAEN